MYREIGPGTTYIEVPNPDFCHQAGQALLLPWSTITAEGYRVERNVSELPESSLLKKITVLVLAIFFWQITVLALVLGVVLLGVSKTYRAAFQRIQDWNIGISWTDNQPKIDTQHLVLRPITADDLPAYLDLFGNETATRWMEGRMINRPANITVQFNQWLEAWEEHPFSALAVVNRTSGRVIGHAMLGIGAFEAPDRGYAEMSIVIDPAYWNRDFEEGQIATENRRHVGSEVTRALFLYAESLRKRNALMSVNIPAGQLIQSGNVHLNANGVVDRVHLPLTQLRASVHRESLAAQTIGVRLMREIGAARIRESPTADLFTLNLPALAQ